MEVRQIGVVGCGLMGTEIGHTCAQAGYSVVMHDLTQELVDKGIASIKSHLARKVAKGSMSKEKMDASLGRIRGTILLDDFHDCDLVIETVVEKIEVKKQVFASLDKACKRGTILASNTSSLSVIDMAAATTRMPQVLGLHFFPPVERMPLFEISKTIATSEEVVEIAKRFGKSLGLTVFITKDFPGFVMNTIQIPMLLQAVRVLEDGLATKEEIDQGMTIGMGHRIGPLALLDYVGLDIVLAMAENIYGETKNMVWAPPLLLKKMVVAGWLGRKTEKGFYNYV